MLEDVAEEILERALAQHLQPPGGDRRSAPRSHVELDAGLGYPAVVDGERV